MYRPASKSTGTGPEHTEWNAVVWNTKNTVADNQSKRNLKQATARRVRRGRWIMRSIWTKESIN